jgi:uncharacterized protein YheU (UPF0270 family)
MTIDEEPIEVPYTDLSPATLRAMAEDFCSRDGTDYGHAEMGFDDRVALLMRQLAEGRARVVFERKSQTVGIVTGGRR